MNIRRTYLLREKIDPMTESLWIWANFSATCVMFVDFAGEVGYMAVHWQLYMMSIKQELYHLKERRFDVWLIRHCNFFSTGFGDIMSKCRQSSR